ncbi:FliM/FliN family flagellar motor switch protein [Buchnera aphidicola]|uniref:Flagellar motor switch protein FliM n=1 Tax=Buchnera aphidicola (Therioaphis trifolii) TaxID=1241884 RepID=A0A4D6YPD5_9GAMM|nr:FliM/FliN family flagellar motor switch protein [Buchnera aphidicola]QCI27065.1 hypothetical protein D9V81_00305 [Buchnera aphidicola (Therioaphis trifolii)]
MKKYNEKFFIYKDINDHDIKYVKIFQKIYKKFIILLEDELLKITKKKFKINIIKNNLTINLNINNDNLHILNTISLINIDCFIFIFFSISFINYLSELIFGINKNIFYYKNYNVLISSKIYIINKLMNIFIKLYNNILKKCNIFCNKYFIDIKNNFNFFIKNKYKLYLNTEFLCKYKNTKFIFIIQIPDILLFIIINQYKDFFKINEEKSIYSKNNYLLNNICNSELNCVVQLEKISILSKYIKNLKIGDILEIKKPNIVTIYTENYIPIFYGKYYSNNNKLVLYVKKNLLINKLNIKNKKI